jgi:hypothetical protein
LRRVHGDGGRHRRTGIRRACRVERLREAEIQDLHRAVCAHFDVRGLEIAVNDPLLVCGFECLRDLFRDRQCFIDGNRAARDPLREIIALDEFHREGGHAPAFFEPIDGSDVRMIERREHFGFALKTSKPIIASRERRRQNLDRDLTLQLRVGRPIHLPHAAFADLGGDFVDAEAGAGC